MKHNPGIGATDELSLRVSVATLVRVVFKHPSNGEWMLALERKATLRENKVEAKSQPFGGAVRILDLDAIHNLIGDFRFDSERSRAEQDFRLFIRSSSWPLLRDFCIQHLSRVHDSVTEIDPTRELVEEFYDAIKINLQPEQYISKPVATVVENEPSPTDNFHSKDYPTVRVYRIFEAVVLDVSLAHTMNSESISHENLYALALNDFHNSGRGWANTVLTLPLKQLTDHYLAISLDERNMPILFEKHRLDETVLAVLDGIRVPKYQRL